MYNSCCRVKILTILNTYSFSEARVEGISLQAASAPDTSRHNILAGWINVNNGVDITEVGLGMLISGLETLMVVFNDGVEDGSEECVCLCIRSVNTNATVQIFNTWNRYNIQLELLVAFLVSHKCSED